MRKMTTAITISSLPHSFKMSNGLKLAFVINVTTCFGLAFGQNSGNENSGIAIPSQSLPPSLTLNDGPTYNFNANTNLVSLLADIRKFISDKDFDKAQGIAQSALQLIQQTEQNKFYLNQIRKKKPKFIMSKLNWPCLKRSTPWLASC